ncbi:hypothetical protein ACZ91_48150, partial [Streptomyces regensis]
AQVYLLDPASGNFEPAGGGGDDDRPRRRGRGHRGGLLPVTPAEAARVAGRRNPRPDGLLTTATDGTD